jgi:hypothetical protein
MPLLREFKDDRLIVQQIGLSHETKNAKVVEERLAQAGVNYVTPEALGCNGHNGCTSGLPGSDCPLKPA